MVVNGMEWQSINKTTARLCTACCSTQTSYVLQDLSDSTAGAYCPSRRTAGMLQQRAPLWAMQLPKAWDMIACMLSSMELGL